MFAVIMAVGFLLLVIVFKIAKGILKFVLILLLLALIVGGAIATRDEAPPAVTTPL